MTQWVLGVVFTAMVAMGCQGAETAHVVGVQDQLQAPESVLYDAARNAWFVSNTAGTQPGDGFISKLNAAGAVESEIFASGLNDPKGQRIYGHQLYVADVTELAVIDLVDSSHIQRIAIDGAQFLNDVAIDPRDGTVYVSDTFTNAVYRVKDGVASVVIQSSALEAPNGLLFENGGLLIASIGPDLDASTFTTSAPGRVQFLDLNSLRLTPISERFGALDGIERDAHGLIVSDFFVGVYRVGRDGKAKKIIDDASLGLGSSADIGLDPFRHRLAVPNLNGTTVTFFELDWERTAP